jgi:hypothetical protein
MSLRENTAQDYPDGEQISKRRFTIVPPSSDPAKATGNFLSLEEIAAQANSGPGAAEAELERQEQEQREIAELRVRLDEVLRARNPKILKQYILLRKYNSTDKLGELSVIVTKLEAKLDEILRKKSDTRPAHKRPLSANPAYPAEM